MERIELFDNYINNQLSDAQRAEFDARLRSDEAFASDFKVYLLAVNGICREVHQDNLDFGLAMKSLSKEKLQEIVGERKIERPERSSNAEPVKILRFKPWMWQAASIAAVIVIAFTVVFNIQRHCQNSIYDNIYASAQFEELHTRGAVNSVDITKLNDSQLKAKLPEMERTYQNSNDLDEVYISGYSLAMAYIRLHKPQKALEILTSLVSKLQHDDYYEPEVREMRLIIHMLE